jgi:hypothetical protein
MSMGQSLHSIPCSNPNVSSLHSGAINCRVHPPLQSGSLLCGIGKMSFFIFFFP